MSAPTPFRVLVCGTNFGRFYAEAVHRRPGYALAGILSRGSTASRAYARSLGVPYYTDPDDLPAGVDAACVAVSSSISGGQGTELARALMDRGIHVLQEHPVHLTELTDNLRHARRRGCGTASTPITRTSPRSAPSPTRPAGSSHGSGRSSWTPPPRST